MARKPLILRFKFDSFAGLPSEPGKQVSLDQAKGNNGNNWMMDLKPGGEVGGDSENPKVSIFLKNIGEKVLHVKYTVILRNALGQAHYEIMTDLFETGGGKVSWGWSEFIERSKILDKENNILVDGALLFDVHLQIKPSEDSLHVPCNPFRTNMLKLLEDDDEENADVSFKVKRTIIRAHKLILKMNAPVLYDICMGQTKTGTPIPIKATTLKNFRIFLRYVYGGDVSDSITAGNGKDIIVAADRYGVPGLKLEAETILVRAMVLTNKNAAGWLLFADAQTCPLLKEEAMAYVIARAADLMNSKWVKELNESPKLMSELMVEMSRNLIKDSSFDNVREGGMSVNELRKSLHEKGLDVDGSKDMLVSRLQESNKRQRTE